MSPRAFSLFECAPENAPGRGLRNLVDDLGGAKALVWGDLLGDELDQAAGVKLGSSWYYECLGQLAGFLVDDADHSAVGDLGVGDQDGLKLGGSDL